MTYRRYVKIKVAYGALLWLFTLITPLWADITPQEAAAKAEEFLPLLNIPLYQKGFSVWANRKCFHFEGPDEERLSLDIDVESGIVRRYAWIRHQIQNQQVLLTLPQAQAKAEQCLKHVLLPPLDDLTLHKSSLAKRGGSGNAYIFTWSKIKNDIEYPVLVQIEIGAASGRVTNILNAEHPVTIKSTIPAIGKESAIRLAHENVKNSNLKFVSARLSISFPNPKQVLRWRIRLEGTDVTPYSPETGQFQVQKFAEVMVDATDGRILSSHVGLLSRDQRIQIRPPVPRPANSSAVDFWPVWASGEGDILYWKWLEMEKAYSDKNRNHGARTAMFLAKNNRSRSLMHFHDFIIHYPAQAPSSGKIAFEVWHGHTVYILDSKTGSLGRVNDPERVLLQMPSWDANEKLLVMSGTHPGSDDLEFDIWVSEIKEQLSVVSTKWNKCIAALPGNDILPQFTPDGQWVIFAHQEVHNQAAQGRWSLYRVQPKSRLDKDYEPPQKILDIRGEPERLSVFPDNNKVLVSYQGNGYEMKSPPEIVDIKANTHRPLKLPTLHDPDLASGKPLVVREPVVSPDGKQIAFRALRWSGNPKENGAICIYTCNLDGSNLKRITPPIATTLVPYQYPKAGITALNAWERLQPKRNLGQRMNREQEWKDALKASGVKEEVKPQDSTKGKVNQAKSSQP